MDQHKIIYLQPECCADPEVGPMWCQDDNPGIECCECEKCKNWTPYILKSEYDAEVRDLVVNNEALLEEIRDLAQENQRLRGEIPDWVQVGDNTLLGAIDHWQDEAAKFKAERDELAARLASSAQEGAE